MYRCTPVTNVCSLCWLSGWLGCLEFQHSATAPIRCVSLWSSPLTEGERRVTGLTVTAEKSIRDNKECNITVTKYLSLVFSPALSLGSVYLSAPLMRFHENSETEQVGVVAPGVGTTRLNREEAMLKDFCYLSLSNPSTARQFNTRYKLWYCTCTCTDR